VWWCVSIGARRRDCFMLWECEGRVPWDGRACGRSSLGKSEGASTQDQTRTTAERKVGSKHLLIEAQPGTHCDVGVDSRSDSSQQYPSTVPPRLCLRRSTKIDELVELRREGLLDRSKTRSEGKAESLNPMFRASHRVPGPRWRGSNC